MSTTKPSRNKKSWTKTLKEEWPGYLIGALGFVALGFFAGSTYSQPSEAMMNDADLAKKFKANWK